MAGCWVPCTYQHYSLIEHPFTLHTSYSYFTISFISTDVNVEEEVAHFQNYISTTQSLQVLIYPLDSLISEFGGALGLFLGFSFLGFFSAARDLAARFFLQTHALDRSVE